jgi:hypothetical protein
MRRPGVGKAVATSPTLMFGVGAPKCGTTWMHRYLAAHPDCHFRALKELHYFDTLNDLKFDWLLEHLEKRVRNLEAYSVMQEGEERERSLREFVDSRDYLQLMGKRVDDRFGYSRFLLHGKGAKTLVGDITPAYGLLPVEVLKEMAGMTERTRLVYLVREPSERLWSHIRMAVQQEKVAPEDFERRAQELLSEQLAGKLDGKRPLREYSDYAGTITRLTEAAPPEKILVMCYEHLLTRHGVRKLCNFLGIRHVEADLGKTVNEGKRASLPEELRAEMRRQLRPQYEFAAKYFKSLPDAWQKTMAEGFA